MKKRNYNFLIFVAVLSLHLVSIVQADDEGVDKSYPYPVEIEENQISEENLIGLLDHDKKRVWNNCFSDESVSEEKKMLEEEEEELYSREDN